jgi:hypothetical protein
MKNASCGVLLAALLALIGVCAYAQVPADIAIDRAIAVQMQAPDASGQLVMDLATARKTGNVTRVRELERLIFGDDPLLEKVAGQSLWEGTNDTPKEVASPQWGDDVKIYTGAIFSYGKRQVATDCDTSGGIYAAFNAVFNDTLSQIVIYKSTNGGRNWSHVYTMRYGGLPIQSFDMCVTDSAGGKWVIGIAAVVKSDKSTYGGGSLWWLSVLSDGTGFRYTLLSSATSTMAFRNPSICTDGTYYAPGSTYHYIASEFISPGNDSSRGLYIRRSMNWGGSWSTADTSLRAWREGTPSIGISWGTSPDSLLVAFTRTFTTGREIRVASNTLAFTTAWSITYPSDSKDDFDPSMALNSTSRQAIITYTRSTGSPLYTDAMYLYSSDLFHSFTRDSIAVTTNAEELTSASYAPWGTSYYFRVAYRSSAGNDTIFYKSIMGTLAGFYQSKAYAVSQYRPSGAVTAAVGYDRDLGGTFYRGNVLYIGYGPTNIYFDAVDLALDVPIASDLPGTYSLDQNYPNPFNPATVIGYQLPMAGHVHLALYDLLGREVAVLVNDEKAAGAYRVTFNAVGLASGMYVYRMKVGDYVQAKKLLLVR